MFIDQSCKGLIVGIAGEFRKVVADLKPRCLRLEIDMRPGRFVEIIVQTRDHETKNRGL